MKKEFDPSEMAAQLALAKLLKVLLPRIRSESRDPITIEKMVLLIREAIKTEL